MVDALRVEPPPLDMELRPVLALGLFNFTSFFLLFPANCVALSLSALLLPCKAFRISPARLDCGVFLASEP